MLFYNHMVPVAPNKSIVIGKIQRINNNSELFVDLEIIRSKNIDGLLNFTQDKVGKVLSVLFKNLDKSTLVVGELVNVYIEYIGDERGGLFHGRLVN
jgi:hypothetical protein